MIIVLFYRNGLMGNRSLPGTFLREYSSGNRQSRGGRNDEPPHTDKITMRFGGVVAVDGLSLEVNEEKSLLSSDRMGQVRPQPSI
jgi:hypothetical protein